MNQENKNKKNRSTRPLINGEPLKGNTMKVSLKSSLATRMLMEDEEKEKEKDEAKQPISVRSCVKINKRTAEIEKANIDMMRIINATMQAVSSKIYGEGLPKNISIQSSLFDEGDEITIPFSLIQAQKQNYKKLAISARKASGYVLCNRDEQDRAQFTPIFARVIVDEKKKKIITRVNPLFVELLSDDVKGNRIVNRLEQNKLSSPYANQLFEILSNQKEWYKTIKELCDVLNLPDSYKNNIANLRKRVLNVARNEMMDKCSFYFDYEFISTKSPERKGRQSYTAVRFIVRKKDDIENAEYTEYEEVKDRYAELCELLLDRGYFDNEDELKHNKELLYGLYKINGLEGLFKLIEQIAQQKSYLESRNRKGYIIGALKKQAEAYKKSLGDIKGI